MYTTSYRKPSSSGCFLLTARYSLLCCASLALVLSRMSSANFWSIFNSVGNSFPALRSGISHHSKKTLSLESLDSNMSNFRRKACARIRYCWAEKIEIYPDHYADELCGVQIFEQSVFGWNKQWCDASLLRWQVLSNRNDLLLSQMKIITALTWRRVLWYVTLISTQTSTQREEKGMLYTLQTRSQYSKACNWRSHSCLLKTIKCSYRAAA